MKQTSAPEQELDFTLPPSLHLISALFAMESTDSLISLSRDCGGGLITESVQRFIWDHCINQTSGICNAHYLKGFLKKLIYEVESSHGEVLDELYEQYVYYVTSLKDDNVVKGLSMVRKSISFLFPKDSFELPSCPSSMKLVVPLQCSLNMLGGDTGYSIWPSSIFLSEFILTYPELFSNQSCFEVGSGVGLVGICLAHVKASKRALAKGKVPMSTHEFGNDVQCLVFMAFFFQVILSDGDLSTLTNMRHNLEMNQLSVKTDFPERNTKDPTAVHCIHLRWESAPESRLREFTPDVILGADVIYDPSSLPHLIRVLVILLDQRKSSDHRHKDNGVLRTKEGPVAYIASVIRNVETFNCFLALTKQANLLVTDLTEKLKLLDLLPYMQSYNRSSIRLYSITYSCN